MFVRRGPESLTSAERRGEECTAAAQGLFTGMDGNKQTGLSDNDPYSYTVNEMSGGLGGSDKG